MEYQIINSFKALYKVKDYLKSNGLKTPPSLCKLILNWDVVMHATGFVHVKDEKKI